MRLVFWQNILSPLQLPYIIHLIDDERIDEVVVVAGVGKLTAIREKMGWNGEFQGLDKCKVYISPPEQDIHKIFEERQNESIHLFSGIRGYEEVYKSFVIGLSYNIKRAIITERPYTYGFGVDWAKPIWLHKLRFFMQDRKYIPHINYIFGIGEESYNYYHSISKLWKVFPFSYCTQENEQELMKVEENTPCRIIFVGALSKRKSVITLLKAVKRLKQKENPLCMVDIVGDGTERERLQRYVIQNKQTNVHFMGTIQNAKLPTILNNHDVLVLPSIHDGWGAVVNEALQAGLYVICSDRCGAKELLDGGMRGRSFKMGNVKELSRLLNDCIENISELRNHKRARKEWAKKTISGKVIATYMMDCLYDNMKFVPWR